MKLPRTSGSSWSTRWVIEQAGVAGTAKAAEGRRAAAATRTPRQTRWRGPNSRGVTRSPRSAAGSSPSPRRRCGTGRGSRFGCWFGCWFVPSGRTRGRHPHARATRRARVFQFVLGAVLKFMLGNKYEFECPLVTVSDVVDSHELDEIDLLKVDVERSELAVLKGYVPSTGRWCDRWRWRCTTARGDEGARGVQETLARRRLVRREKDRRGTARRPGGQHAVEPVREQGVRGMEGEFLRLGGGQRFALAEPLGGSVDNNNRRLSSVLHLIIKGVWVRIIIVSYYISMRAEATHSPWVTALYIRRRRGCYRFIRSAFTRRRAQPQPWASRTWARSRRTWRRSSPRRSPRPCRRGRRGSPGWSPSWAASWRA